MRLFWLAAIVLGLFGHFFSQNAPAAPLGTEFTYQGQLKQAGNPYTGAADFEFTLWNDSTAGSMIGGVVARNNVSVTDGLFTVVLDFGAAAFDGDARWLEIDVRTPAGGGVFTTLAPRQPLTAAPYASYALKAPGSGLWASTGNIVYNTTGNFVGINRSSRVSGSEYFGVQAPVSGTSYGGMYIRTDSATAKPFYGYNTGVDTAWTYLDGNTNKWHVYYGSERLTITDAGDVGINQTSPAAKLEVVSTTGDAIVADTNAAFSIGVTGTGTTAGVKGQSGASNGQGILGVNNTNGGEGVRGSTSGTGSAGVAGYSNFGTGVYGQSLGGGYAIYGSNGGSNTTGYAGYFNGRVNVAGTLSKSGGSFKIDHPLDPANKFLSHSFVESPDMMNIYNGNVVTDADGYAIVTMPDWFEALNRDFRYQLTAIDDGDDFVQVKVVKEIEGNAFVLRSSKAGVKISWQVTGVRHDAWAQVNRIPVEEVKSETERGRYLTPEVFGQSVELRIGLDRAVLSTDE